MFVKIGGNLQIRDKNNEACTQPQGGREYPDDKLRVDLLPLPYLVAIQQARNLIRELIRIQWFP